MMIETNTNAAKLKLFTLLGDHAASLPIKTGGVTSGLVEFAFDDVKIPNTAFKPLVREAKYDLGELAIVTFLQAREAQAPYALLPVTVMGRGQLHLLFHNPSRGSLSPGALPGKRVGVRSYTTTTGAWIRGFLHDLYGVDSNSVTWVTSEEPHVAEYRDPPNVKRQEGNRSIEEMLLAGDVDAAILATATPPAPLVPLVPEAASVERDWSASHGGVPINHMLVIRTEIVRKRPEAVREVFRMFGAAKAAAFPTQPVPDVFRIGIEACRVSLEQIIRFSLEQELIARPVAVDELFSETRTLLG
jgi:4,5-dihydroxyphthalate decarboxylase